MPVQLLAHILLRAPPECCSMALMSVVASNCRSPKAADASDDPPKPSIPAHAPSLPTLMPNIRPTLPRTLTTTDPMVDSGFKTLKSNGSGIGRMETIVAKWCAIGEVMASTVNVGRGRAWPHPDVNQP